MITVQVKIPKLPNFDFDLTPEFRMAAGVIAEEMRGNIGRGTEVDERNALKPNKPGVAVQKKIRYGHSRPLIAGHRTLIATTGSYVITVVRRNFVELRLSRARHPGSNISIARLGAIHNSGEGKQEKREFWGVSATAFKRIRSKLRDKIKEMLRKT